MKNPSPTEVLGLLRLVNRSMVAVIAEVIRAILKIYGIKAGPLEPVLDRLSLQIKGNLDERLVKIEDARNNLIEALAAVDELKQTAELNKRNLEELNVTLQNTESQKTKVQAELDALRGLSAIDTDTVRKALGVPTSIEKWAERTLSFVLGACASLLATAIWEGVKHLT